MTSCLRDTTVVRRLSPSSAHGRSGHEVWTVRVVERSTSGIVLDHVVDAVLDRIECPELADGTPATEVVIPGVVISPLTYPSLVAARERARQLAAVLRGGV